MSPGILYTWRDVFIVEAVAWGIFAAVMAGCWLVLRKVWKGDNDERRDKKQDR